MGGGSILTLYKEIGGYFLAFALVSIVCLTFVMVLVFLQLGRANISRR